MKFIVGCLDIVIWAYNLAIMPLQLLSVLLTGENKIDPWGMV